MVWPSRISPPLTPGAARAIEHSASAATMTQAARRSRAANPSAPPSRFLPPSSRDVAILVSELSPDRGAMLADLGNAARRCLSRSKGGRRRQSYLALRRRYSQAPQMRMAREIGDIVEIAEGDIRGFETLSQRRAALACEDLGDDRIENGAVGDAALIVGKARIAGERLVTEDHLAEAQPFALVLDRDDDLLAVGRGKGAIGRDRGMLQPHARRRLAAIIMMEQRHRHPFRRRIEERDRERRTLAALLARIKRFENGGIGVEPRGDVRHRDADTAWRLGRAAQLREPGLRLNEKIIGLHVAIRPALAIAGDRAEDEARMAASQLGRIEPGARRGTRCQVLQKHIGPCDHAVKERAVLGILDIEHDRLLAAIEPDEIAALSARGAVVGAGEIALGPLDLDDARAGIGQAATAERRRHRLLQCDDEKPVERAAHAARPSFAHSTACSSRSLPQKSSLPTVKLGAPKTPRAIASSVCARSRSLMPGVAARASTAALERPSSSMMAPITLGSAMSRSATKLAR